MDSRVAIVRNHFARRRVENSRLSLRAFARYLDVSPATLSQILSGKRPVSQRFSFKVAEKLPLTPEETAQMAPAPQRPEPLNVRGSEKAKRYTEIDLDRLHMVADWYHFAVLSLAEIPGFRADPIWIAERLGISESDAATTLDRVERLGLMKRDRAGRLRMTGESYSTPDETPSFAIRKSHFQSLELAKRSLEIDPIELRDFTAMTVAIDPSRIPEAKRRIRKFRDRLSKFLETGNKRQVYRINLSLFPLSRRKTP
jgi:transcriptional regulator with XRE-family HTH domain